MAFLKRLIFFLCRKIYEIGKISSEATNRNKWNFFLVGDNTFIEEGAYIQNTFKDPKRITIGSNCHILGHLMLFGHGGKIEIGDYCYVGPQTKIWSACDIKIGDRVLISHNVNVHDNISHPLNSELRHQDFVHIRDKGFQKNIDLREERIIIEDDVWIGFNSTILKGVKIGKGAIIGANTIITKDVAEFAVMVGNPAKEIKKTT